jgi:hypothetical protein
MPNLTKSIFSSALIAAAALPGTGCFFQGYDGVFFEREDVELDVPAGSMRAGEDDGPWFWVKLTATDVNLWVTTLVEGSATVVQILNRFRETSREQIDGDMWRVYGPWDDDDSSKNLAWIVKISGDELDTSFKLYVGERGEKDSGKFDLLLDGELHVDGEDKRDGGMNLYFDTVELHEDMKRGLDVTKTYGGNIALSFERTINRDGDSDDKTIELDFQDFMVVNESFLDDDEFFSDDSYRYHQSMDGSGDFHLGLMGEWDDAGFSGTEMERMELDARWNGEGASRTHGKILEVDGSGDLKHGDLVIMECFDGSDMLVWRDVNEEYQDEAPDYDFGDPASCAFSQADIDG